MDGLSNKLTSFGSFVGMLVVGFENKIISLLRKMDARRRHGGRPSRWKRKPNTSSRFDREIWKLECSVNYNRSPMLVRGKGRSNGEQTVVQ